MEPEKKKGHDDSFRRTWNKSDYVPKSKPKLSKVKNEFSNDEVVKKERLKARDYMLNLDKRVGKSIIFKKTSVSQTDGGYYCDVCQCAINDSINYLDHVNGIKHQKNLGMTMKVERSSLDEVKNRIIEVKKKKEEEKTIKPMSFMERAKLAKEKEAEIKKRKKEAKRAKKTKKSSDVVDSIVDEEMKKVMGFDNFSGK